ncbi:MAG: hypothetical protein AAGF27_05330 [Pseudomonadota bacterium]
MRHHTISETPAAALVLNMKSSEVAPFVRQCVRERSLSVLVKQLNHDLIFGTTQQREEAQQALRCIGFL